jgi:hypothetical protein
LFDFWDLRGSCDIQSPKGWAIHNLLAWSYTRKIHPI